MTYENLTEDYTDATIREFLHELTSGQYPDLTTRGFLVPLTPSEFIKAQKR